MDAETDAVGRPDTFLWGDAADNIPGIPGVGEVTARKLLSQFGSVENLIEKASEIENPKLREKVPAPPGRPP